MSAQPAPAKARRPWFHRLAQYGFWFFLIKGLLWLIVPALIAWGWFAPG